MRPKTFSAIDIVSCIITVLLLLFLFIYPHVRLNRMQEDIVPLCDRVIEAADAENWEEALARAQEIHARFAKDERLMRLIFDHEDVDNALDSIETMLLMVRQRGTSETTIETENVRGIVTYLAGIETLTMTNLF